MYHLTGRQAYKEKNLNKSNKCNQIFNQNRNLAPKIKIIISKLISQLKKILSLTPSN